MRVIIYLRAVSRTLAGIDRLLVLSSLFRADAVGDQSALSTESAAIRGVRPCDVKHALTVSFVRGLHSRSFRHGGAAV